MNKLTERERMFFRIAEHGQNIKAVFSLDSSLDPVELCKKLLRLENRAQRAAKKLLRLENRAQRAAKNLCNYPNYQSEFDRESGKVLAALDKILNFKAKGILVFLNSDPRGYALKIEDDYIREHDLKIYRDFGGYGIIAPYFDGSI